MSALEELEAVCAEINEAVALSDRVGRPKVTVQWLESVAARIEAAHAALLFILEGDATFERSHLSQIANLEAENAMLKSQTVRLANLLLTYSEEIRIEWR
jgi:hypothetical protein